MADKKNNQGLNIGLGVAGGVILIGLIIALIFILGVDGGCTAGSCGEGCCRDGKCVDCSGGECSVEGGECGALCCVAGACEDCSSAECMKDSACDAHKCCLAGSCEDCTCNDEPYDKADYKCCCTSGKCALQGADTSCCSDLTCGPCCTWGGDAETNYSKCGNPMAYKRIEKDNCGPNAIGSPEACREASKWMYKGDLFPMNDGSDAIGSAGPGCYLHSNKTWFNPEVSMKTCSEGAGCLCYSDASMAACNKTTCADAGEGTDDAADYSPCIWQELACVQGECESKYIRVSDAKRCVDAGLNALDATECEAAATTYANEGEDITWGGSVDNDNNPCGCYIKSKVAYYNIAAGAKCDGSEKNSCKDQGGCICGPPSLVVGAGYCTGNGGDSSPLSCGDGSRSTCSQNCTGPYNACSNDKSLSCVKSADCPGNDNTCITYDESDSAFCCDYGCCLNCIGLPTPNNAYCPDLGEKKECGQYYYYSTKDDKYNQCKTAGGHYNETHQYCAVLHKCYPNT